VPISQPLLEIQVAKLTEDRWTRTTRELMEGAATEMPGGAVQLRVDTWPHGRRQAVASEKLRDVPGAAPAVMYWKTCRG
jgi:hypothetical protein